MISVIVPVYKVEQYLDKCVESIVNQTWRDLEIILVDDGSPDNCGTMCDAWAQRDSRIKVIHKENGGAGSARNLGFQAARGDYIALVDSDDYLATDAYEHMLKLMEPDIDVVECGFVNTLDDSCTFESPIPEQIQTCDIQEAMRLHILDIRFRQMPVTKLYRRHLVEGVDFPLGKLIDDEFWTYRVLGRAGKLVSSSKVVYAYRQQPGSAMHQTYSLRRLQALDAKEARVAYLRKYFPELVPTAVANFWFSALYQGQMSLHHLEHSDREEAFRLLRGFLKRVPLRLDTVAEGTWKQKIWLVMLRLSFRGTCVLRNKLHIGI